MPTVVVDIVFVIIILWQTWQNHDMSALVVSRRPFVKRFALCYRTVVCPVLPCLSVCPVCDVGVLWPNGLMDYDAVGTEVGLGQATLC